MNVLNDSELEFGASSTILNNHDDAVVLCERLQEDDFLSLKNAAILRAAKATIYAGGQSTDLHAVKTHLQDQQGIGKEIQISELMRIRDDVPVFIGLSNYIAQLQDLSRLRKLQAVGAEIQRRATDDPGGAFEYATEALLSLAADEPPPPNKYAPLTPAQTRISDRLKSEPPPAEFIMNIFGRPFLKKGIVSSIVAPGGTGKSFFAKRLIYMMASGDSWGPFTAPQKLKTLYLSGEDDSDDLDRRVWPIGNGDFPEGFQVASVVGRVGPLMEFGPNGNPQVTKWRGWLKETILAHEGLDVLILDPMSKFYGLNENSNENANSFINMLQTLSLETGGINIVYIHHANKQSVSENGIGKATGRGASAFRDGVRFELTLKDIDAADAKRFGIEGNLRSYFKMDATKTNYSGEISAPVFFMKNQDTGVPEYIDLKSNRLHEVSEAFYDAFFEHARIEKRRDLLKGMPRDLFEKIKDRCSDFKTKNDMPMILDYLLSEGVLLEEPGDHRGQPVSLIRIPNS
ncbi:MAG: AAA family ATPase [Pseudomonadota bacterium]